ncbi:hypothetical protein NBT05_14250 [Aquimarina sp. ERC-38]|uniref:hypothetical protein n=1 Tax=Aquimarina sp. ERC-38 TaxID=2949996 RepID=UPI0022477EDD|nr:hypothetical protein [Aquimarina sp. ERC-38]UZO80104.1 hypothetical protein NBT05_14250 [Aquimarina sp. ERC-38]
MYAVTKVIPIYGKDTKTFFYKKVKGGKGILILEKLVGGTTECYRELSYVNNAGGLMGLGTGGRMGPVSTYYLGRQSDSTVIKITHGPRFKKFNSIINSFFKECPQLLEKYNSGFFKKEIESLVDMTKFYNETGCTTNFRK